MKKLKVPNLYFFVLFLLLVTTFFSCSINKRIPSKTVFAMNTVCTVKLFDGGTEELYEKLFNRLRELELIFDVNNPDSEISRVNAMAGNGEVVPVSEDFTKVLQVALALAEATDGAFNPACGPLVKLWGINTDHAKIPSEDELAETLPLCDYKNVIFTPAQSDLPDRKIVPNPTFLDGNNLVPSVAASAGECKSTVKFLISGMSLDLGGIAKGYAADELVSILKANNVKRAIIDLGGNIYVYGRKRDGKPWKVGVKNPLDANSPPKLILDCEETSIVTSGVYERFFEQDGKRYHHIIDCKTGYPVENGIVSLTIICNSSLWADALSTTLFVMGEEKIAQTDFSKFTPEFEYIMILNDGTVLQSGS